jgi:transcriptional regulator with XRE-family HTH domain
LEAVAVELPATGSDTDLETLTDVIRLARAETSNGGRSVKQGEIAAGTSRTPQQISQYETGRAVPTLPALLAIREYFNERGRRVPDEQRDVARWLIAWLAANVDRIKDAPPSVGEALAFLREQANPPSIQSNGPISTLANFPGNEPLTIILGDRRETRAKSAADCLIYSGSMTDVMYIPPLGRHLENAVIRSDKLLARMPLESLKKMPELAASNLLVIGSPAANWGSRTLNREALFSFVIDEAVLQRTEAMVHDERMQDEAFASVFWKLAQTMRKRRGGSDIDIDAVRRVGIDPDEENFLDAAAELVRHTLQGSTARAMMNKFRTLGVVDPADEEHHATTTHSANDFAVVTLARNPFAQDSKYRAVICAGIHGPGTASALRELVTNPKGLFERRPLGAVLEIKLRLDLDWPNRFERTTVTPQTAEYETSTVLQNLQRAAALAPDERSQAFKWWTTEAIEQRIRFVHEIQRSQEE